MRPRIIFFGTPVFGQIVLRKLSDDNFNVVAVVTQPDRPVGRDQKLTPSPVKTFAKENKIKIFSPADKGELSTINRKLAKLKPTLFVVASYGMIVPSETLLIPEKGALNVHPSLLPKYRGASPIQAAILNGDTETGVTIMLMDEQMDHGPIVSQEKIALSPAETTATAMAKLAQVGGKILVRTIPVYLEGKLNPRPQDHTQATYTKLVKKDNGRVNWQDNNIQVERMARAYNPWPGVWTTVGEMAEQLDRELKNQRHQNLRLKILQAHLENGTLSLDAVQVEGKKPIGFDDFTKGYLT
ncbi:MAG: methionyl-tRNA formyltransferase, methionyl-tRNA formyltransferase [candidate division WWE3 bacterium CSP1-7]|uniref:Methionyl-tRNA formyltransferase n=2 Tax=Katanobacteria TaxID=422282 RepID=A0A1F4WB39_UNCKA|nr:MAG: methionyl-tRNA formyltransferase, methionyl-tRNA formyltransferase [candidate division WWE3 bacterium CSP1-7]OGC66665.1 MAG: methionyl-tRNA formyltransferase [candidate division WWE3 bacterium RIFCSPLOWO2_02_FULL_53_10]